MRYRTVLVFSVVVFLFVSGCRKVGLDGLVPCRGTVTLDAQPVEGAVVTLVPDRETGSPGQRSAYATSDAAGRFTMTTLKENDGVYPGYYHVMVTKMEPSGKIVEQISPETGQMVSYEPSVNRLPGVYESATTSNLEVTVGEKGVQDLTLDLVTK